MPKTTKEPKIPAEYNPISMWGYFGYEILFMIPIIGWIFIIIFAISAANINLRNFARSQFCVLIIQIVLILIVSVSGVLSTLLQNIF